MYRPGFQVQLPQYQWGGKTGTDISQNMKDKQSQTWSKNRGQKKQQNWYWADKTGKNRRFGSILRPWAWQA